jgi:hypothetical protein
MSKREDLLIKELVEIDKQIGIEIDEPVIKNKLRNKLRKAVMDYYKRS